MKRQNTGLVIVDHGSRKSESNDRLLEFVELYRKATNYLAVEAAHMEIATPTILDAFRACVKLGARQIIVSPFFLLPGRHWQNDIPQLSQEASDECDQIPFVVTAPIGVHEKLVEIMESRIEFCLSTGPSELCDCCSESNNCRLHSRWPTD